MGSESIQFWRCPNCNQTAIRIMSPLETTYVLIECFKCGETSHWPLGFRPDAKTQPLDGTPRPDSERRQVIEMETDDAVVNVERADGETLIV